ncbi:MULTISPECIES: hypothetical protein [unclassified Streptomyces]|uniref:hypothetical protein n=1 Tax=unclassified Streptomyces TaxID=2593676 RepID=UPI003826E439
MPLAPARFRLASGPGYTMHGDFFNVWPEAEMAQRVRHCINAIVKCVPTAPPDGRSSRHLPATG